MYMLAGEIIEKVTSQSWERYIQQNFLEPLEFHWDWRIGLFFVDFVWFSSRIFQWSQSNDRLWTSRAAHCWLNSEKPGACDWRPL